jgi:hypothetical protein
MNATRGPIRTVLMLIFGTAAWLAAEKSAFAQTLLGQTGIVKTMIGWLVVLLAIGLGLLVVCRPSGRKLPDK